MKRAERSEYTYIKNSLKKATLTYGARLTIRTNASREYKKALHDLYTSLNFHPATVESNPRYYTDDQERIVYIYDRYYVSVVDGKMHFWGEYYSKEEKTRIAKALS